MSTEKQKRAIAKTLENGGIVSKAMKDVGYSDAMAKNPQKLTESKGWIELMEQHFSDKDLAKKHKELLNSTRLDHMVFPPFRTKKDMATVDDTSGENIGEKSGEQLTDEDIRELLKDVNCIVRRIVHGEMVRHVYFWSSDNKARKEAIDMAYKLKGRYLEKVDVTSGGLPIQISEVVAAKNKLNDSLSDDTEKMLGK